MNIQFKKGVLELCVLALLSSGDRYGYELASNLSETIEIADGSIYPILRKLAADGQLSTYLRESPEGPPRKYYTITRQGRQMHHELFNEWRHFVAHVDKITGGIHK